MNNQQDKRFFLGIHTSQKLMLCASVEVKDQVNNQLKIQELQNNNLFTLQETGDANQIGRSGKIVILPTNKTISIDKVTVLIYDNDNNLYALYNGSLLSSFQQIDQLFRDKSQLQQKALNDAIHEALGLTQQNHTNQQAQQPEQQLIQEDVHQSNYQTFHVNTNPFEAQKFNESLQNPFGANEPDSSLQNLSNIGSNYINHS